MDTFFKKHRYTLLFCGILFFVGACQSSPPAIRQYGWLNALEHSLVSAKSASDQALVALKKEVKKQGNSHEGLERIKRAELLKKWTVEMLGDIDKIKSHLIKNAGDGLSAQTYMPKHPLNKNKTSAIMRKESAILSKKLNKYCTFLIHKFKDLELPRFELLGKGFKELSFYKTCFEEATLADALLVLTQKQSAVLRYQSEVLKKLRARDLSSAIKFDRPHTAPMPQERYAQTYFNQFYEAGQNPLSTFSIDVDNASYSNLRRYLNDGNPPPKDAVRVEEMINYFDYDYPQPKVQTNGQKHPFSVNTEYGNCPWNPAHKLLHIGLQGENMQSKNMPPSNLVFLLDVSGSMENENKLPLLKKSLKILLNQLHNEQSTVALVVYAGAAGLVLPPTPVTQKQKIIQALKALSSGGSTAGGEGIELAYKIAQRAFIKGGNNRVILATDGDFNVGASSDEALVNLIQQKRKTGVYLTCLGVGMGNYNDAMMEKVSNAGNGNYFYIDNLNEAKKVLAQSFAATLFAIAKDVKIQLEFNPAYVKSYRLIGYENRVLKNKDFKNDKVDAGELGAGHTVTALYEIVPTQLNEATLQSEIPLKYQTTTLDSTALANNELLTIKLRYKRPLANHSQLIEQVIENKVTPTTSNNFHFSAAVTAFGMLLRKSPYAGQATYPQVYQWANASRGKDVNGYRQEFLGLVKKMLGQ